MNMSGLHLSKYPIAFHIYVLWIAADLSTLIFTFEWPRKPIRVGVLFNTQQENEHFPDKIMKLLTLTCHVCLWQFGHPLSRSIICKWF